MSAELPFEYSQRRSALLKDFISAKNDQDREAALQAIEEGDRELEDYLAHMPSGGGGTAQSIIETQEQVHSYDDDPSTGFSHTLTDIAFTVPSDSGFDYYVEWDTNGIIRLNGTPSDLVFVSATQISEHSPGVGFENWSWGFEYYGFSASGQKGPDVITGHGHRIEKVTGLSTATLAFTVIASNITSQRVRHFVAYSAKLIAIPV